MIKKEATVVMVQPDNEYNPNVNPKKVNGWNEWAHKVLSDIERIEESQDKIWNKLNDISVEIAVLKTKAALIGGVWGAVVSIVVGVVTYLVTHHLGGK
jgi:hypothetical protein